MLASTGYRAGRSHHWQRIAASNDHIPSGQPSGHCCAQNGTRKQRGRSRKQERHNSESERGTMADTVDLNEITEYFDDEEGNQYAVY